jgi:serine/threonine protein kinase
MSKKGKEKSLDDFYVFDGMNPDLSEYAKNTKDIKNLLITIRTLQVKKEESSVIDKYFKELSDIIGKFSNCSEFACFINACDNIIDEVKNEINLLKKITERYFAKRVLNEMVPEEWIQAILDTNSSRKKGKCGENKLIHILQKQGYKEVFSWEDFLGTNYCVVKFSKKFSLKNVRKNLGAKIKTKKQNKTLDLIIKAKNKILLCEAKHLNTSGGGQDKQISELIEILSLREENGVSYISFLDGKYSNILLSGDGNGDKVTEQRKQINKFLKKNPANYWVNTTGFKSLIIDFK